MTVSPQKLVKSSFRHFTDKHEKSFASAKNVALSKCYESLMREFDGDKWGAVERVAVRENIYEVKHLYQYAGYDSEAHILLGNRYYSSNIAYLSYHTKQRLKYMLTSHLLDSGFDSLIDYGCGLGDKLLALAKYIKPRKPSVELNAVDISPSALRMTQRVLDREGLAVQTHQSLQSNEFVLPTSYHSKNKNVIVTSYSLQYLSSFGLKDVLMMLKSGIIGGIHVEPCSDKFTELHDKSYVSKAIELYKLNGYTPNIIDAFRQCSQKGLIDLYEYPIACGGSYLPAWSFSWKKK